MMDRENRMIRVIEKMTHGLDGRLNKSFHSDSEIMMFGSKKMLFTTDEFSSEDGFREDDPYSMGWNVAVGAISDILATGGNPLFFAQSLTITSRWNETYLSKFAKGVADVLRKTGTRFIGGDFSTARDWRCTVSIIGELAGQPVLRKGAKAGDSVYISGSVGIGNLEAALSLYGKDHRIKTLVSSVQNRFTPRLKESILMNKYATSCIDTSDGVFNSIKTLCEINNLGFVAEKIPYIKKGLFLAHVMQLPASLLFLGECGEYELLFTVPPDMESAFLQDARQKGMQFFRIARLVENVKTKQMMTGREVIDLSGITFTARDFKNKRTYLKALIRAVKK